MFYFSFDQFYDRSAIIIIIIITILRTLLNNFEASPDFSSGSVPNKVNIPKKKNSAYAPDPKTCYEAAQ
jgi:hypothetical protein